MKPDKEKVTFEFKCGNRIWWRVVCTFDKVINDNDDCDWDVMIYHDDKPLLSGNITTQCALIPTNSDISHWLNGVFGHITITCAMFAREIENKRNN